MNNTEKRVTACFLNVFPGIGEEEVRRASTSSLAAWDSVAHVTLLSAISEEFELSFELEDFEELVSFPLIVEHLNSTIGNA